MEIEFLLKSNEYKTLKKEYEKKYFKLFGKYCQYSREKVSDKSPSEMAEFFKNKKVSVKYVEEETNKKGDVISKSKTISKSFYEVWSNDPDMKEYEDITFDCDVKKVPKTTYNLFYGFTHLDHIVIENGTTLEPYFELIRSLVNYNECHFEYVLNWLAHLVQHPELIPDTSLIFISKEGVGKDLFYLLISNTIGSQYCGNTDKLDNVVGKFNSSLGGKLLFAINETNPVESAQRMENIKALITAKELYIEGKYKDPVKTKNFCRIIFFSNNLFAFPVDENSRRPVIMSCSEKYLPANYGVEESEAYFKNLADNYIKNETCNKAFLEFLKKRDISNWNPKKFEKSKLHETLIDVSIKPLVQFMANFVEQHKDKDQVKIHGQELLSEYTFFLKENNYKFDCTPKKFYAELRMDFGAESVKSSTISFTLSIKKVRELLSSKYKYNFGDKQVIKEPSPIDNGTVDNEKDNLIKQLQDKIKQLEQQLLMQQNVNKPIQTITPDEPSEEDLEKELSSLIQNIPKVKQPEYLDVSEADIDDIMNTITSSINSDKHFKLKKNRSNK